jgi:hypothetical protein
VLTLYLKFVGSRNRERFSQNEHEIERRARRFRCAGFDPANAVGGVVVLGVRRAMIVIVCFAVLMMVDLVVGVNQTGVIEKRMRTRREPHCDHGKNNKGPRPVHVPNLSEDIQEFN